MLEEVGHCGGQCCSLALLYDFQSIDLTVAVNLSCIKFLGSYDVHTMNKVISPSFASGAVTNTAHKLNSILTFLNT